MTIPPLPVDRHLLSSSVTHGQQPHKKTSGIPVAFGGHAEARSGYSQGVIGQTTKVKWPLAPELRAPRRVKWSRADYDPRAHALALCSALETLKQPTLAPSAVQSIAAVSIALLIGGAIKVASVRSLDALAGGHGPVRQALANAACTLAWVSYLPVFLSAVETADTHPYKMYELMASLLGAVAWTAAGPQVEDRHFKEQAWLLIALSAYALPLMHRCVRSGLNSAQRSAPAMLGQKNPSTLEL